MEAGLGFDVAMAAATRSAKVTATRRASNDGRAMRVAAVRRNSPLIVPPLCARS